ncbi:MAG: hypothetical protein Q9M30_06290, partial [Mariprofundaceae bacterium]|nr:hypothetical protein [Mariprofundaceae bacterium]
ERLSEVAPETTIGHKAFMRKMMLQHAQTNELEPLKPVFISLQKLAAENQLSEIEDEAMLDQALLWSRLAGKVAGAEDKALDLYNQVLVGTAPSLANTAEKEGHTLFVHHISQKLSDKSQLESIVLWRRYPQLREPSGPLHGQALKTYRSMLLQLASAMRDLMDFQAAEQLLTTLYADTQSSVEGDRVMLERAKLWLDRGDKDGYAKIMRWLEAHSFTLYRPEMLLLAAGIQLTSGQSNAASQTLKQVAEQDLAPDMRASYWTTKAGIAEALGQWHSAASAWSRHNTLLSSIHYEASLHLADALYMAGEYAKARDAYLDIDEEHRNPRWQYRMAVSEMRSGQWTRAQERLQSLMQNTEASEYALRARLMLADKRADHLMEKM